MARIAVIRSDMDEAQVFLSDLESTSQQSYEFKDGQSRYLERPKTADVDAWRLEHNIVAVTSNTIIAACVPVGGPVDVSTATIEGIHVTIAALNAAAKTGLKDILAPAFLETAVFQQSFRTGTLATYAAPTFSYGGVAGAFVVVVEDDGTTAYSVP